MTDAPALLPTGSGRGRFGVSIPARPRSLGVIRPFCLACAEARLGPAAVGAARRNVASAPPFHPEQVMHLRAIFESAHAVPCGNREARRKTCEHGEPTER